MFVYICFIAGITLVSSNPLLQALTLQQPTCPYHQQSSIPLYLPTNSNPSYPLSSIQNLLPNVNQIQMSTSQNPMTICQNPCPQELMLQNLFQNRISNGNLMSKPSTCQNHMTKNQGNVCKNNPPASNTFYVDRVLDNPTVKAILDPNTRHCNQHNLEILRSPCETPNVVNNYIVIPPEVFMEDCTETRKDKSNKKRTQTGKMRNGRRNNRKRRKNRKNIAVQNKNENTTEIVETHDKVSGIPANSEAKDLILDADGVILEKNFENQTTAPLTSFQNTLNDDKVTEVIKLNKPQTTVSVIEEQNNQPVENQAQLTSINTKSPISYVNSSPYAYQEIISNLSSNANLPNNYQNAYVANNNMFAEFFKSNNEDENDNLKNVKPSNNNATVNTTILNNDVSTMDKNRNNTTKANRKSKRRKNANIPASGKTDRNLKPLDEEELVLQEFKRKFPNIPENLLRDLMRHMKQHLQEQNFAITPNPLFPMNFEQFYGTTLLSTPKPPKKGRKHSSNKNNRRRKTKSKKKQNSTKLSTTDTSTRINSTNANITNANISEALNTNASDPTTSTVCHEYLKVPVLLEVNKIKESETEETVNKQDHVTQIENVFVIDKSKIAESNETETLLEGEENAFRDNPDSKFYTKLRVTELEPENVAVRPEIAEKITTPELGKEDIVMPINMNDVDDYYPDFRFDNSAYLLRSMEDGSLSNLENRYHYTTDRNFEFEELNRERRKLRQRNNKNEFFRGSTERRTHRLRTKVSSSKNTRPKIERTTETEVQFRTPPSLKYPDFETKKVYKTDFEDTISKSEFTKNNNDKISSYSQVKTPHYNLQGKRLKDVPNERDIEMVFANSKVVKYGQNFEDTSHSKGVKETNIPRNNEEDGYKDIDIKMTHDGEKTIVYSKSIVLKR